MIKIGCLARFNNPYENEVIFAKENSFQVMQVWYDRDGIAKHETEANRLDNIINHGFPTIIHALLDINEIEEHIPKLIEILNCLHQKELVLHPICHSEEINEKTIYKLSDIIRKVLVKLREQGITLFLENNSKLDPIFSTSEEINIMFSKNPELEFLIDIAHIYDYQHLKDMVSVKMPKKLHITDSHFEVIHEHIALGEGDIDFTYIFNEILQDFQGDIIIELKQDDDIINAKQIIQNCLTQ
ncbi:MAG: TIM barrel protein [Bacillota bacterium]|nr:TIM barrel protein [Bacillota bacterium]